MALGSEVTVTTALLIQLRSYSWLFFPCVLSSTTSASEDMSECDSAIWYLLQECEKQTLEEYGKPELIQFSDTLSPDLVEFER